MDRQTVIPCPSCSLDRDISDLCRHDGPVCSRCCSREHKALDVSLFDVEDVEDMPKVRDMTVGPVSTQDVQEFARRYHYSATGGNASWRWGLWHGVVLLGIVAYNLPTRETCESVFGPDHFDKVWHMGRLALADEAPHNSESRLIAASLRAIKRDHPNVWGVLTYAATDAGHLGYVYQATNALYTGTGGTAHYYSDESGKRRSTYLGGKGVTAERAASMNWTRREGGEKHRYLYILGSKTQRHQRMQQLRLPILPYPKSLDLPNGGVA